jgi:hypothetical protein
MPLRRGCPENAHKPVGPILPPAVRHVLGRLGTLLVRWRDALRG